MRRLHVSRIELDTAAMALRTVIFNGSDDDGKGVPTVAVSHNTMVEALRVAIRTVTGHDMVVAEEQGKSDGDHVAVEPNKVPRNAAPASAAKRVAHRNARVQSNGPSLFSDSDD